MPRRMKGTKLTQEETRTAYAKENEGDKAHTRRDEDSICQGARNRLCSCSCPNSCSSFDARRFEKGAHTGRTQGDYAKKK
jgi:hypothetical protein